MTVAAALHPVRVASKVDRALYSSFNSKLKQIKKFISFLTLMDKNKKGFRISKTTTGNQF